MNYRQTQIIEILNTSQKKYRGVYLSNLEIYQEMLDGKTKIDAEYIRMVEKYLFNLKNHSSWTNELDSKVDIMSFLTAFKRSHGNNFDNDVEMLKGILSKIKMSIETMMYMDQVFISKMDIISHKSRGIVFFYSEVIEVARYLISNLFSKELTESEENTLNHYLDIASKSVKVEEFRDFTETQIMQVYKVLTDFKDRLTRTETFGAIEEKLTLSKAMKDLFN